VSLLIDAKLLIFPFSTKTSLYVFGVKEIFIIFDPWIEDKMHLSIKKE